MVAQGHGRFGPIVVADPRESIRIKKKSPAFEHWFPRKEQTRARGGDAYIELYARCDRLKYSPLYFMRRRLNGKQGKTYGERNRIYRET